MKRNKIAVLQEDIIFRWYLHLINQIVLLSALKNF